MVYYILIAASIILWFIMVFGPSDVMSAGWFKIVFIIYLVCGMAYSVFRKKYLPAESASTKRKVIFAVMVLALVIKLAFFS